MRVAIYARTASREGNPSPSITLQLERLRTHVAAQGWELPEENVFVDDGYSGNTLDRPGLKQLRARVEASELDSVWLTDMHRLTRSLVDVQLLFEEIQSTGCQLGFLDEPSDWPLAGLLLQ
jgi:site-specific DNA recombinase